jgi:hypothetical protein
LAIQLILPDDWEMLLEGRLMWNPDSDSTDFGLLPHSIAILAKTSKLALGTILAVSPMISVI